MDIIESESNSYINELELEIIDFIKTTILGFENGLYNHLGTTSVNDNFKFVLVQFTVEHYNNIYKSLVLDNEPNLYSTIKINKMNELSGHNHLCLIDILYNLTQKTILNLDRTKFVNSSNEEYISSIKEQLDKIIYYESNELKKILSHECDNIDIKKCDSGVRIFILE